MSDGYVDSRVLLARIEQLDKTVANQAEIIDKMEQQLVGLLKWQREIATLVHRVSV
jgi:uncharacterized coiled-coil protein SlyX